MSILDQIGAQAAGVGMGLLLEGHNDRRQLRQEKALQEQQIYGAQKLTDYQYKKQLEMWEATNYAAQVEQLEKAGLNAGLLYGMSGGGGATTGSGGGGAPSKGNAPAGGGEVMGMMQMSLMDAQRKVLETQAELNQAEADKKRGVDTANVQADTENKILQKVVTDYTGREAKDFYERVKAPNRSVESETFFKEMEARQGIAGTIYDMWLEGKLHEKSISEIEAIALKNAKSREETRNIIKQGEILEENLKGAKMDNIIKDLETRLQTETGIDKNSPTWMKILGRLFVQLMSK